MYYPVSKEERTEFVGQIIDIFEDFLEQKGIDLPNDEKEQSENPAIIYGMDYGHLQSDLERMFSFWDVIEPPDGEPEWFGMVRWCDGDIEDLLEELGVPATQDNIDAVRCECQNNHTFVDGMIAAGWLSIAEAVRTVGLI